MSCSFTVFDVFQGEGAKGGADKQTALCPIDNDSNKSAIKAMHRLSSGRVKLFGSDVIVDWADPQEDPDTDVMAKVMNNA